MVKLTFTLDNKRYEILETMSKESGIEIKKLIELIIINKVEDYREKTNKD